MEKINQKIIIIGAGYAGLCMALFLKKAGIPVVVFEAYDEVKNIGAALTIAPNGMNVLSNIGLNKKVIKAGQVVYQYNFRNHKGKFLAKLKTNAEQKFGQPFVIIQRAALHLILYNEAIKQGIQVNFKKRLSNIMERKGAVTAFFDDGSSHEGILVVGADGIHSAARSIILENAFPEEYTGFCGAGGFVKRSAIDQYLQQHDLGSLNFSFGLSGFFGFGAQNNEEMMWWCTVELPEKDAQQTMFDLSATQLKSKLMRDYEDFHQPVLPLIANSDHILKTIMYDVPNLPAWHKGRTILIGDAAHAVSPTSGLGASLAMEDAMLLAKLLKQYSVDRYETIFSEFESVRKPHTEKIRYETNKRNSDKKILSPIQAWFRDLMMLVFLRLFGMGSIDKIYNYKIEWDK